MFKVALSGDFLKDDGTFAYPDIDLNLLNHKNIEWKIIDTSPEIKSEELEGYDALILLGHRFTKNSVPKDKKLSIISRFGVGYDSVDLEACNDNSIALVITPDGIRRPVAVSVMAFILSLTGNMFIKDKITRNGEWDSRSEYMGKGIVDKTFGQSSIKSEELILYYLTLRFYHPFQEALFQKHRALLRQFCFDLKYYIRHFDQQQDLLMY